MENCPRMPLLASFLIGLTIFTFAIVTLLVRGDITVVFTCTNLTLYNDTTAMVCI